MSRVYKDANPEYDAKDGDVTVRFASREELRFRRKPGQSYPNSTIKQKRTVGDKIPVFGVIPKEPTFKGGEGGRGWSISATTC